MASLLGAEADAFLAALESPAAGLRVNTLRLATARFRELTPFHITPLPFPPEGFLLKDGSRPGAHPYHAAGLYYMQDPGAMVVGALADLPPEPRVIDLAAAPGGKATHLAARMAGSGILVANDLHVGRARELTGNLERCGVRNAVTTAEDPVRLADRLPDWFDVVLVDAPCSGESMFHKSDSARRQWSASAVLGCSRRQKELLREAARLVRPGGTLIYSTCTFAPEENEQVLGGLLEAAPSLSIEPLPAIPGSSHGRPDWASSEGDSRVGGAMRLWPHRFPGAGHFVAVLRRSADSPEGPVHPGDVAIAGSESWHPAEEESLELLDTLLSETLPSYALPEGEIVTRRQELHLLPRGIPSLEGIRVLRPGLWLGSARKGRFEPSHSLALAVDPESASQVVDLPASSAEVAAYLAGEAVRMGGADGWVLVTVDGFGLGWGKRSGGVLKNHYPRGLRRR